MKQSEIVVVGAGVIGLAAALRLANEEREVTVIDPNPPGSGASYGNAGTIADYAVIPVGTPAVLRALPSLLFNSDSPLSLRYSALPSLMPWLLRFVRQSQPGQMRRNAEAIAALLADSASAWRELVAELKAEQQLKHNGCLYIYESEKAVTASMPDYLLRQSFGIAQEWLSAREIAAMEPQLPAGDWQGLFFPDALFLSDPGAMMALLAAAARDRGVRFLSETVTDIQPGRDNVGLQTGSGFITAEKVILAAGAFSRDLARQCGDLIPLETERGYHVEYDMDSPVLSRPVSRTSRGFYVIPMAGRLRVAGTVELGGLEASANPRRIALLEQGVKDWFPKLGKADREWLGFRPSIPDSVPVIGYASSSNRIIYAFGHGHLGLTLAPVTARMVFALAEGRRNDSSTAYSARRFH